ncbi:glycosyl hydrolase [Pontibacter sp. G13]|uniref:glycoside hydrolase family 26 protein n=1 Tax=Pontibacter sp. G13 TaxID=3074898 RepID=UPI00288AD92D|nr:glycosyl hydrolase [Pontibacter sp. G13]WNJ21574.1 glycosyl hydrolase [Pontibacter sp. G13]
MMNTAVCLRRSVGIVIGTALGLVLGFSAPLDIGPKLADPDATPETRALYASLHQIAPEGIMFGHQDDLAYGVEWTRQRGRSDVRDVCGSYPAVYGWDLGHIGDSHNIDSVEFKDMQRWARQVFRRGGVNTYSWHIRNLATGGGSWDTTKVVGRILPGGDLHADYLAKLDAVADFFLGLKTRWGRPIPVLFRPFHEHTGSWFWWGKGNCSPAQYRQLWHFTLMYLRDVRGVHNLLYVYSPDVFSDESEYLRCYPGDEFVDILGLDDYHDMKSPERLQDLTHRLGMVVKLAEEKGKVAALTETGLEKVPHASWWTDMLLEGIAQDSLARKIVYVLVWRNDREDHHYAPFPGHPSSEDFVKFRQSPMTLFEDDLPKLYKRKRQRG